MKNNTKVGGDKSRKVAVLPMACQDETAAAEFLEEQRWGNEPRCPHCGDTTVYKMQGRDGNRNARFLWRCRNCGEQYTVRIGTVLEDSRIPLRHWCFAFWAACASKKGISALQIKRMTGLSYKSALFMMHRVRFAMSRDDDREMMLNGTVEADETYVGGKPRYHGAINKGKMGRGTDKAPVFAMVERGGRVRAMSMPTVNGGNLRAALRRHVSKQARLVTDDSNLYGKAGGHFEGGHDRINHSRKEYVKGDIHTNTIEGFFALLKRGIIGTFHNVSRRHLDLYLAEFEFRYNGRKLDDGERTALAIKRAQGKKLYYRMPVN